MARHARFGGTASRWRRIAQFRAQFRTAGAGRWLTSANPGVIVGANIEMARRRRNIGSMPPSDLRAGTHAAWSPAALENANA